MKTSDFTISEMKALQAAKAYQYNMDLDTLMQTYVELAGVDAVIEMYTGEMNATFGHRVEDLRVALHAHPLARDMDRGSLPLKIAAYRDLVHKWNVENPRWYTVRHDLTRS